MDEIQLVLVDFDNLRGTDSRPLSEFYVPDLAGSVSAPTVVAFAMNLNSVDEHTTFGALKALAERIAATMTGGTLLGFEVALTLPVKETADVIIERLLLKSPAPAHEGLLAAVHLLSEDNGLKRHVRARVEKKKYQCHRSRTEMSCTFDGKGKPLKRKRPPVGTSSLGRMTPSDPHQAILDAELIERHGGLRVDIPEGATLAMVAEAAGQRCGLLTQVGPTLSSLRGIDRLAKLATGRPPTLSPCAPDEGLELCAEVPPAGDYDSPALSSLGPGAVRFASPPATVSTLLPHSLLEVATPPFAVAEGRLLDAKVLEALDPAALSKTDVVEVTFEGPANELRAEVYRQFSHPLPTWWREANGKTRSKIDVRGPDFPSTARCSTKARLALHRGDLILVGLPTEPVHVTIERCASRVVAARTEDGLHVACLLPLGARPGRARYTPIQQRHAGGFGRLFPELANHFSDFRRLPLLVPG